MQVPDKYYINKKVSLVGRYSNKENINKTKAALGMIENIDENIGNVVSALKEKVIGVVQAGAPALNSENVAANQDRCAENQS